LYPYFSKKDLQFKPPPMLVTLSATQVNEEEEGGSFIATISLSQSILNVQRFVLVGQSSHSDISVAMMWSSFGISISSSSPFGRSMSEFVNDEWDEEVGNVNEDPLLSGSLTTAGVICE